MRYRRNNLFLPLVILSATRHIHEPITHLIYKAKNVTNDVRRAGPVGASTPVVDATAGLHASTTADLNEFEPVQVQLPEAPEVSMKTEFINPLPPYPIRNIHDICVSQAAPLPEQSSVPTVLAALDDLMYSVYHANGGNSTHTYGHLAPPHEIEKDYVRAGDELEMESSNDESTMTYRPANPFVRVAVMTKDNLVDTLVKLLLPFFDCESLVEIIQMLIQGESMNRPADETTLSHVNMMANFLYAIFCAGWYVPWKGKPRPKASIREAQRVSARPFSIRVPCHNREYNRLQKKLLSKFWLSGRMDNFSSLVLPSGWSELLLDNGLQPFGRSVLRAILRFVYTTLLCVLRFPGNFLLICLCIIYLAISGAYIAIKGSVLDTWETTRWQYYAAVNAPRACMSIIRSFKCSRLLPTWCSRRNASAPSLYTNHRSVSPELPIAFPILNGLASPGLEARLDSLRSIAQPKTLEEDPTSTSTTAETLSVLSDETELEKPATPFLQPCRSCRVVADAERCICTCDSLKITYSQSRIDLSFYDDLIDYYRSVVDNFTDHLCMSESQRPSRSELSGPDDNFELLAQMREIGGDDQRITELLERYCDSPALGFYEDDSLLLLSRLVESASAESMTSTSISTSTSESTLIVGEGQDPEKTPMKGITLADIASLAKVVDELHHSYMTGWS